MMPGTYTVAVRTLCEFTAKRGDLDLRFTPAPSAQQGIEGHQAVAARRGPGFQAELALAGEHRHLRVRGRADGYDPHSQRLEEFKTFKGDLSRQPANHRGLHWAQARIYGWLLCRQLGLARLTIALIYVDVATTHETVLLQDCTADELRAHFEAACERFLDWADREMAHRARRDGSLAALRFPYDGFRTGQRALAEAVYRAARAGRCLMAQAPTGIGKTLGTLFPVLKACPGEQIDKVYFLTAKGSGASMAMQALQTLRTDPSGVGLRVIELAAREKACEHPDKACHGDSCPLARGFYDRLPAAREAAAAQGQLSRGALREIGLAHGVCPYYLGQEMVRWSDVVVGDYNYYYDTGGLLHALALANQWRVAVLVDEAHNLVERARSMYSAPLHHAALRRVRTGAPAALRKPLDRLHRAWNRLAREQPQPYRVLPEAPRALVTALQGLITAVGDWLADQSLPGTDELLRFHFEALHFARLLEAFGDHSLIDLSTDGPTGGERREPADTVLCVRNVVPGPFLAPRFSAAHSTVLFSATLTPAGFYTDTLGLPADTVWVDVEAPFRAEQLSVQVVRSVSTRFARRGASLAPIARLIADQYAARPGNYLAFFSSYDYLDQVAAALARGHPGIPWWAQSRRMPAPERERFLARFTPESRGVGFAVLGGSFAEGVDLPGERLIGAFIATLGLPQVNPVNEAMCHRLQAAFGRGHDYTYLYPGIRKVVQAAGRVIRTPTDRGSIHLIDERFARPQVLGLLPDWWHIDVGARAPA